MLDQARLSYNPKFPLGAEILHIEQRTSATVQDIHYVSPRGGKVSAYLVTLTEARSGPGLLYAHWGQANRNEFLEEACSMASEGFFSLCLDAPFARQPELHSATYDENDFPAVLEQHIIDIRRGLDLLEGLPDMNARHLALIGHSFGASYAPVVAHLEARLHAFVLMGPEYSNADIFRKSNDADTASLRRSMSTDAWETFPARVASFDAEQHLADISPRPLLLQLARDDEFVSQESARRTIETARDPKTVRWYEGGHAFNGDARHDRVQWLLQWSHTVL